MKTSATAKFVGTSPRKIGLVAALIRGQKVTAAESRLALAGQRAAGPVGKVLNSALANAENNHNLKKADLIIESVLVGPGPTLKRYRPRAKGVAGSIFKRSSHITVILSDQSIQTPASAPAEAVAKPEAKTTKPAAKKPAAKAAQPKAKEAK